MKLLLLFFITLKLSALYTFDYETNQCEQYTTGAKVYLFADNNGCVLKYQVGDFYYDTNFYKTFQIDTALQCINNTNTWYGLPLTFDTLNPLTCSNTETLDKASCSCNATVPIIDTNTTVTSLNNTIGLTNNDYNFMMSLSGLIFSSIVFLIVSSFIVGL